MHNKNAAKHRLSLITAMTIFSTIGLLRKYIALPSGAVALCRAGIGAAFLLLLLLIKKQKPNFAALRKNAWLLLLSGAALGFNWIALFEAYNHTTVATATLCYYMAPMLVILVSPILFRERLTGRKLLCVAVALIGIVLVSGVTESANAGNLQPKGILYGLSAAALYATVIILNKKISNVPNMDRTLCQLLIAGITMLPYVFFAETPVSPTGRDLLLLGIAGVVHTGIAYALYFGSIAALPAQTSALYSYLDPILAIILSFIFLREPLSLSGIIGAVLILGAAILSEQKTHSR